MACGAEGSRTLDLLNAITFQTCGSGSRTTTSAHDPYKSENELVVLSDPASSPVFGQNSDSPPSGSCARLQPAGENRLAARPARRVPPHARFSPATSMGHRVLR